MGDKKEEEIKIPVFTVIKNGAILKNIFIVNKPPSPSISQDYEETLIVGRHPDCDITLTHPSISRFHLQIHSNPSNQHVSLIDLSSVHGTWVSEKKLEPGVRLELKEGDTVRVGGSSRIYRLHWVLLSHAYDSENPFVPPAFDLKEDENAVDFYQDDKSSLIEEKDSLVEVEGKEEKECQDENSLSVEIRKIQSQDLSLEELDSSFSNENLGLIVKKEIPSAPPLPEHMMMFDEKEGDESLSRFFHEPSEIFDLWSGPLGPGTELVNSSLPVEGVIFETENQQLEKESRSPKPHSVMEVLSERDEPENSLRSSEQEFKQSVSTGSPFYVQEEDAMHPVAEVRNEAENNISFGEDHRRWSGPLMMENLSLHVEDFPAETNNEQVDEENQTPQRLLALQSQSEMNMLVSLESASSDEEGNLVAELIEETKNPSVSRKDHEVREISSLYSVPIAIESVNPSLIAGEVLVTALSEITETQESQCPQSIIAAAGLSEVEISESSPLQSEEKLKSHSIWSRRGKAASVPLIQIGESRNGTIRAGIDAEVESQNQEDTENKSISKALFTDLDEEEEIFTPNKENFTPNTLLVKSLKKKGKVEETNHSKSCRSSSSNVTFSPGVHQEEDMTASLDKENQTPKVLREQKSARPTSGNRVRLEQGIKPIKRRSERVPFQSLLVNSTGKSRSDTSVPDNPTRSCNSVTCTQTKEKKNNSIGEVVRSWNMVVDTATLLNKESRKSLHLLQGLKGTNLIIPRMVLRELDCLKRRGSLFRRKTEASSVLEWIEECMVKTKWWIHVQSTFEEARAIAPTPPASPQSCFSEGSVAFSCGKPSSSLMSFSSHEIVSPTAEDNILDCALLYGKMKNEGRLVLLSDDVTLKIKAMAEGLICETAQEFRESLVNPFSDRFLWAESSPRGLTWSYKDDVVLREQYYRCPLKKSAKGESAKGLKLILRHNSHYGQISSVSKNNSVCIFSFVFLG